MDSNSTDSDGSNDMENELSSPLNKKKEVQVMLVFLVLMLYESLLGQPDLKPNSIQAGRRNGLVLFKLLVLSMNSNVHCAVRLLVVVIKVKLTFLAILMEQSTRRELEVHRHQECSLNVDLELKMTEQESR